MLCETCHIYVSGDVLTLYWQVVNPGGVLVHTQFWDLNYGVADSWGIHGLWYASEKPSLFSFMALIIIIGQINATTSTTRTAIVAALIPARRLPMPFKDSPI